MSGLIGGALIAAVILVVVYLLFGYRAAHGCSVRMAFIATIASLALVTLIAALGHVQ